jgi:hypothetical protein
MVINGITIGLLWFMLIKYGYMICIIVSNCLKGIDNGINMGK